MHPQNLKHAKGYANQVEDRNQLKERLEEKKSRDMRSEAGNRWSELKPSPSKFSNYETSKSVSRPAANKEIREKGGEDTRETPPRAAMPVVSTMSSNGGSTVRKRLSEDEINRRRELGLCFTCDGKYWPNHKCNTKQLQLIVWMRNWVGPKYQIWSPNMRKGKKWNETWLH